VSSLANEPLPSLELLTLMEAKQIEKGEDNELKRQIV
jgi:hypothetical protein